MKEKIKLLEERVAEQRKENLYTLSKLKSVQEENTKLQGALEESIRLCKEYAEENEILRTRLEPEKAEDESLISPFNEERKNTLKPEKTPPLHSACEGSRESEDRSMSEFLGSISMRSFKRKSRENLPTPLKEEQNNKIHEAISLIKISDKNYDSLNQEDELPPPLPLRDDDDLEDLDLQY